MNAQALNRMEHDFYDLTLRMTEFFCQRLHCMQSFEIQILEKETCTALPGDPFPHINWSQLYKHDFKIGHINIQGEATQTSPTHSG